MGVTTLVPDMINGSLGRRVGKMANGWLGHFGLQLVRCSPELRSLASYSIKTVLDIGASNGGFLRKVRTVLPGAFIYCFEPLPEQFAQLQRTADQDPQAKAWNMALGSSEGVAVMHKSGDSCMSSLLPMTEVTTREFPGAVDSKPLEVTIRTLDNWAESQELELPILIKLDVQGYEGNVIRGGTATFRKAQVLLMEVSFMELYAGQCLFDELYGAVRHLGFRLVGTTYPLCDHKTGRTMQTDAIFARSS